MSWCLKLTKDHCFNTNNACLQDEATNLVIVFSVTPPRFSVLVRAPTSMERTVCTLLQPLHKASGRHSEMTINGGEVRDHFDSGFPISEMAQKIGGYLDILEGQLLKQLPEPTDDLKTQIREHFSKIKEHLLPSQAAQQQFFPPQQSTPATPANTTAETELASLVAP